MQVNLGNADIIEKIYQISCSSLILSLILDQYSI